MVRCFQIGRMVRQILFHILQTEPGCSLSGHRWMRCEAKKGGVGGLKMLTCARGGQSQQDSMYSDGSP